MKIFSNFDTQYKKQVTTSYIEEYGSDNILVVERSRLFARIHIHLPSMLYITIGSIIIFLVWYKVPIRLIQWTTTIVITGLWIRLMIPVVKRYIDYLLDFAIITPKGVFLYNQTGILSRKTTSLNVQNIRTITLNKEGLLYSIFNNGDIIILSEGDQSELGEAKMLYVKNPEIKRKRIKEIFAKVNITNY